MAGVTESESFQNERKMNEKRAKCKLSMILIFERKVKNLVKLAKCITFAPIFEQRESKSRDNMTKCNTKGLYQSRYEHDACGVGMVVNIHGGKSHELVDNALKVLENMEHRGA